MTEDTRNHWKMDNLGKVSRAGILRIAADPRYKGECIYSPEANCPTVRCLFGGGATIAIEVRQ